MNQFSLSQAIAVILDSDDLSSTTASSLRSKLESKFDLDEGTLTNHRDLISSLMSEYIDSNLNLKQTEMDELDKYLESQNNDNSDSKNSMSIVKSDNQLFL